MSPKLPGMTPTVSPRFYLNFYFRPGFPLYEVLAKGQGIQVKHYDLSPDFVSINDSFWLKRPFDIKFLHFQTLNLRTGTLILNHLKMRSMIKLLQLYLLILQTHVELFSVRFKVTKTLPFSCELFESCTTSTRNLEPI